MRPITPLAALGAGLALAASPAAAAPRIVGSTAVPKGLSAEYGLAPAPGGGVYALWTPSRFLSGAGPQSRLALISRAGKVRWSVSLPVRDLSVIGFGIGTGRNPWISGYTPTNGWLLRYVGGRWQRTRFANQTAWQGFANVGGRVYAATGGEGLRWTGDAGRTWSYLDTRPIPIDSDTVLAGAHGRLWYAGDGGVGRLDGGVARAVYADATRTSRYLALAKDGLWFTDWVPSSGAGPRIGRLPLSGTGAPRWMVRGVRAWFMATGPDGRPWVGLARGKVARISTSGALTRLSLPRRYDGSEMTSSGGYVWYGAVQPFNAPDPGRSVIVRIRP